MFTEASTQTASEFVKVGKDNPCPICNKSDWCKVSPDGNTAMCGRTGTIPIGWKKIKDTVDGQGIYKLESDDNLQKQVSGRRPTKKVKKAQPAPRPPFTQVSQNRRLHRARSPTNIRHAVVDRPQGNTRENTRNQPR